MEYQKIINLIDNAPNQSSKFRTKNWAEKLLILKRHCLCDYGDAYTLLKGNITVDNTAAAGADKNNTNKKVIFKNYAPFTDCMREINNTQVDNAKYIDIVMPMYDLIEYSDNYSKTSVKIYKL